MIHSIIAILISATVVFVIGLPIVNWLHKAKKEMEEQDERSNQP